MLLRNEEAYEAGIAAGRELTPMTTNPFPQGSPEWSVWRSGWDKGSEIHDTSTGHYGVSSRKPSLDEIERRQFFHEVRNRRHRRGHEEGVLDCLEMMEDYDE